MAAFVWQSAAIFVGGHSSAASVQSFNINGEASLKPADTFGNGGYRKFVSGIKSATVSLGGLQDYDTAGLSTYLAGDVGRQMAFTVALPGTAEGDLAVAGRLLSTSEGPLVGGQVDEVGAFNLELVTDTKWGRGLLLAPLATQSSASNTTGVAMTGPTAAQTLCVALHVTAVSSGTWTVLVESDSGSGFATPTTRLTFSTFTAQGWQFQSVAGNFSSETHLRVAWSVAGGSTPTATFAVSAFIV